MTDRSLRRVCVFAGSSPGARPEYAAAAAELGRALATAGVGVVYGGGAVGLMGVLADAALEAGGDVVGVIPEDLHRREVGHTGLTELSVVDSMHERKALMADLSDGFVLLPGGIGSLEEFVEVLTWDQLGIHAKPCVVLDVASCWTPLLDLLDAMVVEGFLRAEHRAMVGVAATAEQALERLVDLDVPQLDKWLGGPAR